MKEITYRKEGDYLIPNLYVKKSKDVYYHIGKYGNLRLNFIREYKKSYYTELKMNGELRNHLIDIDKQAKKEVDKLIKEFAKIENVPLYFDGSDAMLWVGRMNNIKDRAEEIVFNEIIFI
ncbi:MAG: TnpV protein [Clostridia bacterium]|nr:TnpV protein [Clostridia bacterium]